MSDRFDLVLASGSPRRHALLRDAGVQFRVVTPDIDETLAPTETPDRAVARLAIEKARAVAAKVGASHPVLAADTVVALADRILGKPRDSTEAAEMLTALSGRTHTVWTGFALLSGDPAHEHVESIRTEVTFRALSRADVATYVAVGESLDKAGAYAAQGAGATLIASIEGSRTNVIGLPLERVLPCLARAGVAVGGP